MVVASARVFGTGFPFGTLTVNIIGSVLMGMVAAHAMHQGTVSEATRVFVMTGLLGGFTTFSAFSLDVVSLFERGETLAAGGYIIASVLLSVVGLMLGMAVMRP